MATQSSQVDDVERRLEASGVTLYVIGEGRALKVDALRERMDRLARSTGGRAIVTEKIDDLRGAFAELLDELSHQYLLGYAPTNASHDGTLRQLKVEVEGVAHLEAIRRTSHEAKMNFRYFDERAIGISLDETTSDKDVLDLLCVFNNDRLPTFTLSELAAEADKSFPPPVGAESGIRLRGLSAGSCCFCCSTAAAEVRTVCTRSRTPPRSVFIGN